MVRRLRAIAFDADDLMRTYAPGPNRGALDKVQSLAWDAKQPLENLLEETKNHD